MKECFNELLSESAFWIWVILWCIGRFSMAFRTFFLLQDYFDPELKKIVPQQNASYAPHKNILCAKKSHRVYVRMQCELLTWQIHQKWPWLSLQWLEYKFNDWTSSNWNRLFSFLQLLGICHVMLCKAGFYKKNKAKIAARLCHNLVCLAQTQLFISDALWRK